MRLPPLPPCSIVQLDRLNEEDVFTLRVRTTVGKPRALDTYGIYIDEAPFAMANESVFEFNAPRWARLSMSHPCLLYNGLTKTTRRQESPTKNGLVHKSKSMHSSPRKSGPTSHEPSESMLNRIDVGSTFTCTAS